MLVLLFISLRISVHGFKSKVCMKRLHCSLFLWQVSCNTQIMLLLYILMAHWKFIQEIIQEYFLILRICILYEFKTITCK